MPTYSFRCRECGAYREVVAPIRFRPQDSACRCGGVLRRVFHAPAIVHGLVSETHFNHSIGKVIHSESHFRSELSRRSDEMSERLGFEQRLAPIPAGEAPGVTDQVSEWRRKRELKQGAERKFAAW